MASTRHIAFPTDTVAPLGALCPRRAREVGVSLYCVVLSSSWFQLDDVLRGRCRDLCRDVSGTHLILLFSHTAPHNFWRHPLYRTVLLSHPRCSIQTA